MIEAIVGVIIEILKWIAPNGLVRIRHYLKVEKPIRIFFKKTRKDLTLFILPPADIDPIVKGTQIFDFLGAMELQDLFRELGYKFEVIRSDNISEAELKGNNLLIVGGPIPNKIAKYLFNQNEIIYKFGGEEGHDIIDIKIGQTVVSPQKDEEGRIRKDYGILTRMKNPYNPEKDAIIASGCFGWGTQACLRIMKNSQAIKIINEQVKDKYYFQIIVSVQIDEDKIPLNSSALDKMLKILDYNLEGGGEKCKE